MAKAEIAPDGESLGDGGDGALAHVVLPADRSAPTSARPQPATPRQSSSDAVAMSLRARMVQGFARRGRLPARRRSGDGRR